MAYRRSNAIWVNPVVWIATRGIRVGILTRSASRQAGLPGAAGRAADPVQAFLDHRQPLVDQAHLRTDEYRHAMAVAVDLRQARAAYKLAVDAPRPGRRPR